MKKNTCIITTFLLALGIVACSEGETDLQPPTAEGEELSISAGITITLPAEQTQTRAGETTPGKTDAFTSKDFSLIVKDNRANKANASLATAKATTQATSTSQTEKDPVGNTAQIDPALAALDPKLYWDDLGGKLADLNLVGIYPTTANPGIASDLISWNVGTDQSKGIDASDLLLAYRPGYKYTDKRIAANLNFNHIMAKVTINLIKGANYGGGFLNPALVLTNLPASGKVNIVPAINATGEKSYTITEAAIADITPTTPALITETSNYTTSAIVLPATIAGGTIIAKITVDGNEYNVKAPAGVSTSIAGGSNNVFNVTVNKSGATVSATITDWTNNVIPEITSKLLEVSLLPITDTEITVGSTLLVSIKDAKGVEHTVKYIATFKSTEDKTLYWVVSGTPLYWDDISYPAAGTKLTANALLRVGGDQSEDICTGSFTEITEAQAILTLALKRQMSKVTVKLVTTDGSDAVRFTDADRVTLPAYQTYQVVGTTLTRLPATADLSVPYIKTETAPAAWVYETIIIPQTIAADKYIITVQVGANIYNVPVSTKGTAEIFAAGEHKTYIIKIKKSGINASATITGWLESAEIKIDTDLEN